MSAGLTSHLQMLQLVFHTLVHVTPSCSCTELVKTCITFVLILG